jgi:AraC-like DNA-binding protein
VGSDASTFVSSPPAPGLAPFVEQYVGYRVQGTPSGLHRGLPSRHMTFIVSIGPTIDVVRQTDPAQHPARYRAVLSGLQASPALIEQHGDEEGVAIELTPLGSRALFRMPTAAVWNTTLELAEVAGPAGDALWERLQGPAAWPERFAVCDDVLGRLVRGHRGPPAEVLRAWDVIVGTGGAATVADLAAEVGWSRQHLSRRFTGEFGLGPKLAARVVRFERARGLLREMPSFVTVAQVAAVCGYYDQAHLDRDFAELAGCSPTQWLREEVPSVQATGGVVPSS